jgi:hypothetical protein
MDELWAGLYTVFMHRTLLSLIAALVSLGTALPAHALVWHSNKVKSGTGVTVRANPKKPITRKITNRIIHSETPVLRNNKRRNDLTTIGNAIFAYRRDNNHILPKYIPLLAKKEICRFEAKSCAGMVDLKLILTKYITTLPSDPTNPKDSNGTGYFIEKTLKDRVTLTAPNAEEGWFIRVQK